MPNRIIKSIRASRQRSTEFKNLFGKGGAFTKLATECKYLTRSMENKSDLSDKPLNTLSRFTPAVFAFKARYIESISQLARDFRDKKKKKMMLQLVHYLSNIPQSKNLFFDPQTQHHDDAVKILCAKNGEKFLTVTELKTIVKDLNDAQYAYAHGRTHFINEEEIVSLIRTYRPLVNQSRSVMIEITEKIVSFQHLLAR